MPKGETIFPGVWQMQQKQDIKTQEVKAHKSHLAFDGSRMQQGLHYNQTYAPAANWASVCLILTGNNT